MYALSEEELATIASYKKIAPTRVITFSDPNFWLKEFEKLQQFLPSGKIIDIGCGHGRDTGLFIKNGYSYTGIDASIPMLEEAIKLNPDSHFKCMNMYHLDFPPASFDGFWAATSILHIPKKNVGKVFDEIRKVVKKGGIGFIAMKEGFGEKMIEHQEVEVKRFFAFYTKEEFKEVLEANGFEVLDSSRDLRIYNPPRKTDVLILYFVRIK